MREERKGEEGGGGGRMLCGKRDLEMKSAKNRNGKTAHNSTPPC